MTHFNVKKIRHLWKQWFFTIELYFFKIMAGTTVPFLLAHPVVTTAITEDIVMASTI